jgi:hypothetical protein
MLPGGQSLCLSGAADCSRTGTDPCGCRSDTVRMHLRRRAPRDRVEGATGLAQASSGAKISVHQHCVLSPPLGMERQHVHRTDSLCGSCSRCSGRSRWPTGATVQAARGPCAPVKAAQGRQCPQAAASQESTAYCTTALAQAHARQQLSYRLGTAGSVGVWKKLGVRSRYACPYRFDQDPPAHGRRHAEARSDQAARGRWWSYGCLPLRKTLEGLGARRGMATTRVGAAGAETSTHERARAKAEAS